eukprot:4682972-Pyramimonas_sp.AAC.1
MWLHAETTEAPPLQEELTRAKEKTLNSFVFNFASKCVKHVTIISARTVPSRTQHPRDVARADMPISSSKYYDITSRTQHI